MPIVPPIPAIGSGVLTTTQLAQLATAVSFLQQPPAFRGRQSVAQSLTNGLATAITLDAEDLDSASGHTTTSRYVAQYDGWYWIAGGIGYASNGTGIRGVEWWVNGSVLAGSGAMFPASAASSNRLPGRGMLIYLTEGDYVELYAFQSSGGALNTAVATQEQPSMSVGWYSR